MKILIADDKEESRYLLQTVLEDSGYDVVTAKNGEEALEKLRADGFDLIVADILMPKMDGYELCQICKSDEALRDIPFVFHTAAYTDKEDEEFALQVGADKFIRKPMEPADFIAAICGVIGRVEEGEIQPRKPEITEEESIRKHRNELMKKLGEKIEELRAEIAERRQIEEELRKSEEKYKTLTENVNVGIYRNTVGPKGKFIEANPAIVKMFGYKNREEFLSMNVADLYQNPEGRKKFNEKMLRIGFARDEELKLEKKDGTPFFGSVSAVAVKDEEGKVQYYDGIIEDITERKRVEEQIKTSLKEKELLLREIHHRVKNNLQVISSLLNLQSQYSKDKQTLEMFKESQNRIKSMALIHEKLYQAKDLMQIDFAEYTKTLTAYLFHSYGIDRDAIALKINTNNVSLDVDMAIPCGLIINELVSNSLKYAFPDGGEGEILIGLRLDTDKYTLIVSDDGIGFPKDLDFRNTESLGLQLVNILVEQLGGTIEFDRSKGTEFKITFPELKHKEGR